MRKENGGTSLTSSYLTRILKSEQISEDFPAYALLQQPLYTYKGIIKHFVHCFLVMHYGCLGVSACSWVSNRNAEVLNALRNERNAAVP